MNRPLTLSRFRLSKKNDERVQTLMRWDLMFLQWCRRPQAQLLSSAQRNSRFRSSITKHFPSLQRPLLSTIRETKLKCSPMVKVTTWVCSNTWNTVVQITKRFNPLFLRRREDWLQKGPSLAVSSCETSNRINMLRPRTNTELVKSSWMDELKPLRRW